MKDVCEWCGLAGHTRLSCPIEQKDKTKGIKESVVKDRVKKVLDKYKRVHFKLWYDMPVPSGYGKSQLDFTGIFFGRAFAIETKRPGKKLSSRQEVIARDIKVAGGKVFVIDDEADELQAWFEHTIAQRTKFNKAVKNAANRKPRTP